MSGNIIQILILQGIPASGKSTFAQQYKFPNDNLTIIIERDIIRETLFDCTRSEYKYTKSREKAVTDKQREHISIALKKGYNIIISDTNLNRKNLGSLKGYINNQASLLKVTTNITTRILDVPLADCMKRNQKRQHTVPESVLIRMQQDLRKIQGKYVHDHTNPDNLPECILVDIDGTVADMAGKRHPFEWGKVGGDLPKKHIVNVVTLLMEKWLAEFGEDEPEVIFMSGRDSICRHETFDWLYQNIPPVGMQTKLLMRPEGDSRPDTIIKEELFDLFIKNHYHVTLVIDDRKCMVQHWQSMGFNVMDVGNGISDF